MSKTLKIIFLYFTHALQLQLANVPSLIIFFISKLLRYGLFLFFLHHLTTSVTSLAGYSATQVLLFYVFFNIIDTSAQMLFREVYRFRPLVVSGNFDMVLAKPFPVLARVLLGGPDFIDLAVLLILVTIGLYYTVTYIHPSTLNTLLALLLILNALLISAAFHIVVLGIGILTFTVDHLIMIYRDLTSLMRIPVDFFPDLLRTLFTFVLPIGVMFTFPAKALFGLLDPLVVAYSFLIGLLSLFIALHFWRYALTHYSSAGS